MTCWLCVFCTSTMGDSPVTVTVSSIRPKLISTSMVAENEPDSSTPSRFTVVKPVNVNVTSYMPGGRATIR